jgi:LysR family glycine cleavage system transcriptional activator
LSIQLAARELAVTPSAVSRQIKSLEDQLGVPLFVRGHRAIALTGSGAEYLRGVQSAFAALVVATGAVRAVAGPALVKLSIVQTLAANWLVPRLPGLAARYPEIELQLVTGDELADVAGGEVDLAVRFGNGAWPGVRSEPLLALTAFPVVAPALAGRALREPADLARLPWLHLASYPQAFRAWLAHVGAPDVAAARNTTFDNADVLFRAAELGLGVAMATRVLAAPYLESGRLLQPFSAECPVSGGYHLVTRADAARAPAVVAVRAWLLEAARGGRA